MSPYITPPSRVVASTTIFGFTTFLYHENEEVDTQNNVPSASRDYSHGQVLTINLKGGGSAPA